MLLDLIEKFLDFLKDSLDAAKFAVQISAFFGAWKLGLFSQEVNPFPTAHISGHVSGVEQPWFVQDRFDTKMRVYFGNESTCTILVKIFVFNVTVGESHTGRLEKERVQNQVRSNGA